MADILAAVDLNSVLVWVGGIGVTIVAIHFGFKAITLARRGVNKA